MKKKTERELEAVDEPVNCSGFILEEVFFPLNKKLNNQACIKEKERAYEPVFFAMKIKKKGKIG